MAERSGCLKYLGPLAELFAVKDKPGTRFIKTESGISVELQDDQPDEFAEGMAQTFLTGKATFGYFDEEKGEFIIKELE